MFIVDNSNSMKGGKFENACKELFDSVDNLSNKQKFYVKFKVLAMESGQCVLILWERLGP